MRTLISLLLIIFFTSAFLIHDAQAKRFGGGRSIGMQRPMSQYSRVQPRQPLAQRLSSNRWFAPLAGLLAGGLLASLFMGHGIGTGILSWLIVAGIALLVINLLRGRFRMPAPASSYYNAPKENLTSNSEQYFQSNPHWMQSQPNTHYPVGFDSDSFLREAKVQFIRLQAAYDRKNLDDLRQFTAPHVFAEIQLQLQDRGDEPNQTEVISVDAKLLDVNKEESSFLNDSGAKSMVASVQFTGLIRENSESAESFKEIWHFQKDKQDWVVAGIQQA